LAGGGAKSLLWQKIIADVTGLPISTLSTEENTCLGASILAGVGVGVYKDVESAVNKILTISNRVEPRADIHNVYNKAFSVYKEIYKATKDLFRELYEIEKIF